MAVHAGHSKRQCKLAWLPARVCHHDSHASWLSLGAGTVSFAKRSLFK